MIPLRFENEQAQLHARTSTPSKILFNDYLEHIILFFMKCPRHKSIFFCCTDFKADR